jgi:uncharacterized protein
MTDWSHVISQTVEHVQQTLAGDSSGHDWWHIDRVRRNAVSIAKEENADLLIVELAALLHDIADWKFHGGDLAAGSRAARNWLAKLGVDDFMVNQVSEIIAGISFKGAGVATEMPTLEGRCVQDGDRLDAIGAIGIARAFAFGGHFGRPMYDPEIAAELHQSFAAYQTKSGPTINHFYEKLLLLKNRMQTATGKKMAIQRHQFMELFLQRFFDEWNGGRSEPVSGSAP